MGERKKAVVSAFVVVALGCSIVAGDAIRERLDAHDPLASAGGLDGLLASKSTADDPSPSMVYDDLTGLLKLQYVDPINDDKKLALGAVRGMVASLAEVHTLFMDPTQATTYRNAIAGKFDGIGATVALISPDKVVDTDSDETSEASRPGTARIPRVTITALVPGGPADKAGLKVGDWLHSIDGRWVADSDTVDRMLKLASDVAKGKTPADQLMKMRKVLRAQSEHAFTPVKARDALMTGTLGTLHLVVNRGASTVDAMVPRGSTSVGEFRQNGRTVTRLAFDAGGAASLEGALKAGSVRTIDLRNNAIGDFKYLRRILGDLAPKGTYGKVTSRMIRKPRLIAVDGAPRVGKLTLLVDRSTSGPAEMLAVALSQSGHAKLVGGPMAGDRVVTEIVDLPGGGLYTLAVGHYVGPKEGKK